MSRDEVYKIAMEDIKNSRELFQMAMDKKFVKEPPKDMLQNAMDWAVSQIRGK